MRQMVILKSVQAMHSLLSGYTRLFLHMWVRAPIICEHKCEKVCLLYLQNYRRHNCEDMLDEKNIFTPTCIQRHIIPRQTPKPTNTTSQHIRYTARVHKAPKTNHLLTFWHSNGRKMGNCPYSFLFMDYLHILELLLLVFTVQHFLS